MKVIKYFFLIFIICFRQQGINNLSLMNFAPLDVGVFQPTVLS